MKVKCKYEEVNDALIEKLKLHQDTQQARYTITKGKEYVVLGISYSPSFAPDSQWPTIEIKDDSGYLYSHPLFLFDVVDDRASKHWHVQFNQKSHCLNLWPISWLENEFYHDDLSNDFPEVLKDFERVYELLANEFED